MTADELKKNISDELIKSVMLSNDESKARAARMLQWE